MNKKKVKICFITSTRAEYGLIKSLMKKISSNENFVLQIIVTGTHLSRRHGFTIDEIEKDGFKVNSKIDMFTDDDSNNSICLSLSKLIEELSAKIEILKPDTIVILGDRFELLGIAAAATIHRVPLTHLHGGEITEGAFDDSIRHAITKLSQIHFVANEQYKKRIIQLGENPENIFNVGGLGVDAIKELKLLSKSKLEKELNLNFLEKNLLVTYHPLTLSKAETSKNELTELINSLSTLKNTLQIFTMPNADPGNKAIFKIIKSYVKTNKNAFWFNSLGQLKYLSCLAHVDAVIGNSSSGLSEAPTFKIATINIGDRQKGRLMSQSIINCEANSDDIKMGLKKIYQPSFREILKNAKNPYGDGGASRRIIEILKNINYNDILRKKFFNIPINIE